MGPQFQQPNLPIPKTPVGALNETLGTTIRNLPTVLMEIKLKRMQQEKELAALERQIKVDADASADRKSGLELQQKAIDIQQQRADQSVVPKPPPGFRSTADGNLEAIPGGPADIKLTEKSEKEKLLQEAAVGQANKVISKVDQALGKVSGWSTGWGAKAFGWMPGTDAKALEADIKTIKANLGFAQLQEMRRNSPTGGALGQVAIQELEMLQSTIDNLDPQLDKKQLKENLSAVKTHYENWKKAVGQSEADTQTKIESPEAGAEEEGYKFLGGDPADPANWEKL